MTERDADRGEGRDPIDEEAAWAEIVAGYGEEPADPPGVWPRADETDLTDTVDRGAPVQPAQPAHEAGHAGTRGGEPAAAAGDGEETRHEAPAPEGGPRDWEAAEDEEDDHFVPPEPPPLPETDLTTKLAWVAVIGGPLLLIGVVLLQRDMTWWLATLGIGGFLGGFATLFSRMRDEDDDEWPDPGSGAVV
ncbi:hypothetical protein ACTWP5_19525 [Streptomyces sp. 4N509B]|uniref:hypothetical protein n=1 Tax=Streptomyces sp. 4N509B TaxID=3457413 RepID=UPI003FCFB21B